MCGRRKLEKDYPELCNWGDMEFNLVEKIAKQLPSNIIVQFHRDGDPLCYPRLKQTLNRFKNQIRCFNTNGKLLLEKAEEIIDNMETLTISVIENDSKGDEQYEIVKKFLEIKGSRKPYMIYRLLGNVENKERWEKLPGLTCTRILHNPLGSFDYTKKVTIPEVGFCTDLMSHLVINRHGSVFSCVRYDPTEINKLGNIKDNTLEELWNCKKRQDMIKEHIKGNRNCSVLCSKCSFWGVPTGA
jgi:radical SAM protein with 4Fe4S-binding SPASM domain